MYAPLRQREAPFRVDLIPEGVSSEESEGHWLRCLSLTTSIPPPLLPFRSSGSLQKMDLSTLGQRLLLGNRILPPTGLVLGVFLSSPGALSRTHQTLNVDEN